MKYGENKPHTTNTSSSTNATSAGPSGGGQPNGLVRLLVPGAQQASPAMYAILVMPIVVGVLVAFLFHMPLGWPVAVVLGVVVAVAEYAYVAFKARKLAAARDAEATTSPMDGPSR